MGCLRKRMKSLIARPPSEIMLCLGVVLIALSVDFISARAYSRAAVRLTIAGDRGETELPSRGFVCVGQPGRWTSAGDVLRTGIGDG
jgi:hypothetical protein